MDTCHEPLLIFIFYPVNVVLYNKVEKKHVHMSVLIWAINQNELENIDLSDIGYVKALDLVPQRELSAPVLIDDQRFHLISFTNLIVLKFRTKILTMWPLLWPIVTRQPIRTWREVTQSAGLASHVALSALAATSFTISSSSFEVFKKRNAYYCQLYNIMICPCSHCSAQIHLETFLASFDMT